MQLNLITRATVKRQLGIGDSTYNTDIDRMLPIVSNDVRRILNCKFNDYRVADFTSGSTTIEIDFDNRHDQTNGTGEITMGQVVYHPNIPDDTYIVSYDPDEVEYTLSSAATADGDHIYFGLNISQWAAVSKMIWYRIQGQSTTDAEAREFSQITYGNVSKTFAPGEINRKYNYPQVLLNDLGVSFAVVG